MAMDKVNLEVKFQIRYVVLLVGVLITVICAWAYTRYYAAFPLIKEVMMISAAGVALTALVYNAMTLHFNITLNAEKLKREAEAAIKQNENEKTLIEAKLNQEKIDLEAKLKNRKKQYAAQLISEWHSPEMSKLSVIANATKVNISQLEPKDVIEYLKGDPEKEHAMVATLNYLEKLAICINHDIADEPLLKDFFEGIVKRYHYTLKGLINLKRRELQNNRIFEHFIELAVKWDGSH
jgi:hypothetical protein